MSEASNDNLGLPISEPLPDGEKHNFRSYLNAMADRVMTASLKRVIYPHINPRHIEFVIMEEAEKQVHQLTQDSYDVAWVVGQIALRKVVEQIQFWRDSDADQYGPEFFISYYDPKDGMTPNCKADVLTCILRFVAIELDSIDRKAIPFEEVLGHVMRRSSGKEQDVAHEVRQAVFLLARTGLVVVDTYDWSRKTMTISAGTVVKKSPLLHEFVYGEDDAEAVE